MTQNQSASSFSTSNAESTPFLSVELPDVLHALRRRFWIILVAAAFGAAAFYVGASRQPKVYVAKAKIVVDPVLPKVLDESFDPSGAPGQAEFTFYNTQYEVMRSRAVLQSAVDRLRLTDDAAFLESHEITEGPGPARAKAVLAALKASIEILPELQSRIVTLVAEAHDPNSAAMIANAVAQAYIDHSLDYRLSETHGASKWLDERVQEFAHRLDSSENALQEFKRANTLVSVSLEDRKNMVASRLTSLNDKLNEIRTRLIELESERDSLRAVGRTATTAEVMLTTPRIASSKIIDTIASAHVELAQQRAKMSARYGPRHPNMAALDEQARALDRKLAEEVTRHVRALNNQIAEITTTKRRLDAEVQIEVQNALELNQLVMEYNRLNRDAKNAEKTYDALMKRRTETDLSGLLHSNFTRWLETAEPVTRPIRPSLVVSSVLGGLLGLVLSVVFVLLGVVIDTTIHTQEDIEQRLRLPFLGVVPSIEEIARAGVSTPVAGTVSHRDLFIVKNPRSTVAECVRSLRTNLLFLGAKKPLRTLLVTSAGPSEGKSTAVVALGVTMAQAGNRVLVIDTDFRRPRLHKTFGLPNSEGLTSVLLEQATLEQATRRTEVPNLDLLACGPIPPNPSELMHTEQFRRLLMELVAKYDRVLLDSPPINLVTDATILSQITDGTILVTKASATTREAARQAARQLLDINAPLLGVVLNDVDLEEKGYYRQQKYYYYARSYEYRDSEREAKA